MTKYTPKLPATAEENKSSIIIESIAEKLESFMAGKAADPRITEIQEIMARLTIDENFKNADDIAKLFSAISDLAESNPDLVEILEEFQKLPAIQELEQYSDSHDATAREDAALAKGDVGDKVANEYDIKTGIALDESEEAKKKRLEDEKTRLLNSGNNHSKASHYKSTSQELDGGELAAMIIKLAGALAIGLACPQIGLVLAALFLYGTRNIANGKKITYIDRQNDDERGLTSDVLSKFMAEQQKNQAPNSSMEQATAGIQDEMEVDLDKIKKDLIEAKALLEKAVKPDVEIDIETAKKYDVKLNDSQLQQEQQHSQSEQKGQKCLIKLDRQQGEQFKKNLDEKIAKCEAQIEQNEGR
jgi:hypothetical protein